MDTYFTVTPPGIQALTAQELQKITPTADFLHFGGGLPALYRANLHLRTASRVLVRLGQPFYARTFAELRQKADNLPWERFLPPGKPVQLRVSCHQSKLYHSGAVAERLLLSIAERLGKPSPLLKPTEDEEDSPAQLIIARLEKDLLTLSIDSSGASLHRRGYKQAVSKAPLRENLAAALLLASAWDVSSPLIDPFCGSGTIVIEAALLAQNIAPGLNRRFAFMDWQNFDQPLWQSLCAEAQTAQTAASPFLLASDRDAGAVRSAQENAERAGVQANIQFKVQAVSGIAPPAQPGWLVTNPPYGVRVSEGKDLRNLYAQLGNVLRAQCPGWQTAVLCNDPALIGQMRVVGKPVLAFSNGGVPVKLYAGKV